MGNNRKVDEIRDNLCKFQGHPSCGLYFETSTSSRIPFNSALVTMTSDHISPRATIAAWSQTDCIRCYQNWSVHVGDHRSKSSPQGWSKYRVSRLYLPLRKGYPGKRAGSWKLEKRQVPHQQLGGGTKAKEPLWVNWVFVKNTPFLNFALSSATPSSSQLTGNYDWHGQNRLNG